MTFRIDTANGMVHVHRKPHTKRWVGCGSFTVRPLARNFAKFAAELFPGSGGFYYPGPVKKVETLFFLRTF